MMVRFFRTPAAGLLLSLAAAIGLGVSGAQAQMQTFDPDTAIDGDLNGELPPVSGDPYATAVAAPTPAPAATPYPADPYAADPYPAAPDPAPAYPDPYTAPAGTPQAATGQPPQQVEEESATYKKDDLIGAAEGVFGKGAEGLAKLIEDILHEQGEPNAYITGREAGGAIGIGLRYGSGTMHHKVEGQRDVYWTGPSIGFDAGANAGSTFILIYNLWDSEELYERYPAAEGQAYFVGGFNASYMRKGDVVLIPVRLGVGVRLGVNAGYMKFSKKQRWLPF